jgi:hypothetical protein
MDIFSPTIIDNALITGSDNANLLQVSSPSAVSALFVSGSGRVGIGTTSPTNTLQVAGGITATSITSSTIGGLNLGQFTPYIRYNTNGISPSSSFGHDNSYILSEFGGGFGTNDLSFYVGSFTPSEIMRIVGSTGFVGIGESSPSARLEIKGSGATSATTALRVENSNASTSLVVLDNGNVGIGTTAPTSTLHVSSSSDTPLRLVGSSNGSLIQFNRATSYQWAVGMNNASQFRITDDSQTTTRLAINATTGEIGIGTTTPLARLHVSASSGNDFFRITSGSQNILTIRSGSAVMFSGTGTTPSSGFDVDIQGTGTVHGGTVRIAGNSTAYAFGSVGSIVRSGTGNLEMFNMVMGGTTTTGIQNPLRVQFDANQNPTSGSGYIVLRVNATHATTAGTGSKLLQTWEFGGVRQSVMDISGSLGIGTGSTPAARLFVSGANNQSLLQVSSPSASQALSILGSGNVGIGTSNPTGLIDVVQGGNSRIFVATDNGFVGIQQNSPAEYIHISSDPTGTKYLQIDAAQVSNPPPIYLPAVPAKETYGNTVDDRALGTPDYWMEIKLDGNIVLIPCYTPEP